MPFLSGGEFTRLPNEKTTQKIHAQFRCGLDEFATLRL